MRLPADIACCPFCHAALSSDGTQCTSCHASFPSYKGLPNHVVGPGAVDADRRGRRLLHSIVANPKVYDVVQRMFGERAYMARLARVLGEANRVVSVLDVGAGTGVHIELFGTTTRYIWLDSDPRKLDGFAVRAPHGEAILGNALQMPVRDRAVDAAFCSAVTHHLDDAALSALLAELSRVVRKRLYLVDALRARSPIAATPWMLDRGAYPRTETELIAALESDFDIEQREVFTIVHRYLLVSASPKRGRSSPSDRAI